MNRAGGILILLLCGVAISSSYKLREKNDAFDVIFNKEAERRDVEAIQISQMQHDMSRGIRETVQKQEGVQDQGDEYFFQTLGKAIAKVVLYPVRIITDIAQATGAKPTETGEKIIKTIKHLTD
ncbi:uncharacterized protein LOC119178243 [Rhipicephalus microplus]|uniref:uncharacterized protein LOC119178243 n=1 Tax=Rhipicephalus microplus TaxID=6941 RepID=UPI00188825F5|nr:uncharacterized protein LOC119178243 [Rhipicephalus microplus]